MINEARNIYNNLEYNLNIDPILKTLKNNGLLYLDHIIALKLYTDFSNLQRKFKSLLSYASKEEKKHELFRFQQFYLVFEDLINKVKTQKTNNKLKEKNKFAGLKLSGISEFTFQNNGFFSTSENKEVTGRFAGDDGIVLEIKPSKKSISVKGISNKKTEDEVLYINSQIEVVKYDRYKKGKHIQIHYPDRIQVIKTNKTYYKNNIENYPDITKIINNKDNRIEYKLNGEFLYAIPLKQNKDNNHSIHKHNNHKKCTWTCNKCEQLNNISIDNCNKCKQKKGFEFTFGKENQNYKSKIQTSFSERLQLYQATQDKESLKIDNKTKQIQLDDLLNEVMDKYDHHIHRVDGKSTNLKYEFDERLELTNKLRESLIEKKGNNIKNKHITSPKESYYWHINKYIKTNETCQLIHELYENGFIGDAHIVALELICHYHGPQQEFKKSFINTKQSLNPKYKVWHKYLTELYEILSFHKSNPSVMSCKVLPQYKTLYCGMSGLNKPDTTNHFETYYGPISTTPILDRASYYAGNNGRILKFELKNDYNKCTALDISWLAKQNDGEVLCHNAEFKISNILKPKYLF